LTAVWKPFQRGQSALSRYLLFQIPGCVLAAVVLALLVRLSGLSSQIALLLFALWVVKDFVLYPLVRIAYEPGNSEATEGLIGALGIAQGRLDPDGYVRIGAELWRAEVDTSLAPLESGAGVRVQSVHGLTLRVEPE
jgi:membrane protein implicated in regulation of membrane protease activity